MDKAGTPPDVMQSYELIREVLKTTSAKQVSADLGLSMSLIYKWAEKPEGCVLDDGARSGGKRRILRMRSR